MVVQSDDRIVLAGTSDGDPATSASDCAVVRLTAEGVLDTTFSGSGSKAFSFDVGSDPTAHADRCQSVAVQQDGKIVLAGAAQSGNAFRMALARLQTDGSFDSNLSSDIGRSGRLTIDFGASEIAGIALRVRETPSGGLLVIGEEIQSTGSVVATGWGMAKLHADGTPDPTFGNGGVVFYQLGLGGDSGSRPQDEMPYDFVALPDDSFVVAGAAPTGTASGTDMAIVKFSPSGAVDTTWGNHGRQIIAFDFGGDNDDVATSIVRDLQGRFIVGGYVNSDALPNTGDASDFMVLRLLQDGSLDSTFGVAGTKDLQLSSPQNLNQQAYSVAIAADQGILIGGSAATTTNGGPYAIGVVKLVGDTVFAGSFGE